MSLLTFRYRGRDRSGQQVSGQVEALDKHHAQIQVRELGLLNVVVSQVRQRGAPAPWWLQTRRRLRDFLSFAFYRVSHRELAIWARSASFSFKAGMNPYQAMTTIAESALNPILRQVSLVMAQRALKGERLAPVLADYPWAFPTFIQSMVTVGEESGILEDTFARLADYYEHMHQLVLLQKRSTFYTKLLIVAALLIIPFPRLVLQGVGAYVRAILRMTLPWVLVVGGGWLLLRALGQVEAVRTLWDRIKIGVPKLGQVWYKQSLANWGVALSMLVHAGLPVHRAVVTSASALGNRALERDLLAVADHLLAGKPLSVVLRESGAFPPELVDIVAVGDNTGNTGQALERLAAYYEQESRVGQRQVVTALAVLFYVVVAAALGLYIISFWGGYAGGLARALG